MSLRVSSAVVLCFLAACGDHSRLSCSAPAVEETVVKLVSDGLTPTMTGKLDAIRTIDRNARIHSCAADLHLMTAPFVRTDQDLWAQAGATNGQHDYEVGIVANWCAPVIPNETWRKDQGPDSAQCKKGRMRLAQIERKYAALKAALPKQNPSVPVMNIPIRYTVELTDDGAIYVSINR